MCLAVLLDYAMGFLNVVVQYLLGFPRTCVLSAVLLDYIMVFPNVVVEHLLGFPRACLPICV